MISGHIKQIKVPEKTHTFNIQTQLQTAFLFSIGSLAHKLPWTKAVFFPFD